MEAARDLLSDLPALAEQMIQQPICQTYGLDQMPLSLLSQYLEEQEKQLKGRQVAAEIRESFQQFKTMYCTFLMQLEESGQASADSLAKQTLLDYLAPAAPEPQEQEDDEATVLGIQFIHGPTNETESASDEIPAEEPIDWSSPPPKAPSKEPAQSFPRSRLAQEYYSTALYFRSFRESGQDGIAPSHLLRLEGLQICYALEIEFQENLKNRVQQFWKDRRDAVVALFSKVDDKVDLHPDLAMEWQKPPKAAYWPEQELLPLNTFKNSLRLFASAPEAPVLTPNLLECGLWLFAFGQDKAIGRLNLRNLLAIEGLSADALADALWRLCRTHRLKATLMQPETEFLNDQLSELQNHASVLFGLLPD